MKIYFSLLLLSYFSATISTTYAESRPYQNSNQQCMAYSRESNVGAIVVNSCPKNYTGPALVRRKCSFANDFSDPLMANFITDVSARVTFQNIYCAECNNAPYEALEFWKIALYCESLLSLNVNDTFVRENIKYRNGINKWGVMFEGQFHQCDLSFEKPDYLNVRQCHAEPALNCPPSWHRNAVKKACSSCINSANNNPLRNFYCLICHSEPDTDIICNQGRISTRSENRKPFSFALLLDANRSDGDIVGISQTCVCSTVPSCSIGEKYDPFFKICRKLVCDIPGFKWVETGNGRKCARA